MLALVVCLNGTFILEQPGNSMFEYYQRFRDFTQKLMEIGGRHTAPCHNFEAGSGLERTAGMPSSDPGVAYLGDAGRLWLWNLIWVSFSFIMVSPPGLS